MLVMNDLMSAKYEKLNLCGVKLPQELSQFAESGFVIENDCYFIRKCFSVDTNVSVESFPDKTGYECFINSVCIDDFVDDHFLENGICFVKEVFERWNKENASKNLISIMILDELSLKVKFHVQRESEWWLADDLDEYEESVLIVDSTETEFSYRT